MMHTLLLAVALTVGVHPLHTTHTDLAEEAGGRVRITIRSFSDDLRTAVRAQPGESADSACARYVRAHLTISPARGAPVPLVWDQLRTEGGITFLVLHATLPGGLHGALVRQEMQTELYGDQVNVLQSTYAGRQASLLFLPGDGPKPLP